MPTILSVSKGYEMRGKRGEGKDSINLRASRLFWESERRERGRGEKGSGTSGIFSLLP